MCGVLLTAKAPVSAGEFNERVWNFSLTPETRVVLNAPPESAFATNHHATLVIYALPNGNTIEQTIGRRPKPGDDWHFDIQHIGAQTRFLRQMLPASNFVVAYLEARASTIPRSWPAWRQKNGNEPVPGIVSALAGRFPGDSVDIYLTGHSGGGAFIFGYINAVAKIPNQIKRIAFLDSDYAYDAKAGHARKLADWLNAAPDHYLCVLAYNDAAALYEGKPFVTAEGGTWGRTHALLKDLKREFPFTQQPAGTNLVKYSALNGRIEIFLKDNPEKKIYHTIQVERNGFIQSILSGTIHEGRGYQYFGERAYEKWIESP